MMESLMQYVWQHRLLLHTDLATVDGERVSVIDPGRLNTDSGPDFFNAKIRIGDKMWAGDVETGTVTVMTAILHMTLWCSMSLKGMMPRLRAVTGR